MMGRCLKEEGFCVFVAAVSTASSPLLDLTLAQSPRTSGEDIRKCTELQHKVIWNAGKEVLDV